jgi:FkbM family methyltransferase
MKMKNLIKRWLQSLPIGPVRTYSQQGEDMLISLAVKQLRIAKPSYMDIGASHPFTINNTALFYKKGMQGVNIEPDPAVFAELATWRPRDTNLNIAVGDTDGTATLYVFNHSELNTLSKEEADERAALPGLSVQKTLTIPVLTIGTVINKYCNGVFPDILSLDAEGFDEKILQSIDFAKSYPKIICVETLVFAGERGGSQNSAISDFLMMQGYAVFAFTHVNTIFIKN